jgi:hypothetical protein
MNAVVVDTDVVSYLFKSHTVALQYLPDVTDRIPIVSFMTVAELDRWILEAHWGDARRKRLHDYLEPFVVLPYDRELCLKWAEVTVAAGLRAPDRLRRCVDRGDSPCRRRTANHP